MPLSRANRLPSNLFLSKTTTNNNETPKPKNNNKGPSGWTHFIYSKWRFHLILVVWFLIGGRRGVFIVRTNIRVPWQVKGVVDSGVFWFSSRDCYWTLLLYDSLFNLPFLLYAILQISNLEPKANTMYLIYTLGGFSCIPNVGLKYTCCKLS